MGGNLDESLLSTASTLIDSCSTSFNESFDDENNDQVRGRPKDKNAVNSFLCRGRITDSQSVKENLSSPTTTAISLEITESATERSERTTVSKLERLRARTRLLRKQGSQKIEESRASLRKSRTVSIEESLPSDAANPPPYPPPSVHNKAREARSNHKKPKPTSDALKYDPDSEFSDFLRRSNSVIDRLSTEIAMAGNIINQSLDCDATFNDEVAKKTNDFTSNLCAQNYYSRIGQDERSIQNDENSVHNISVGEDWDQTTISATLPGTPSSSAHLQRSMKVPPTRPISQSGLPPPEVVVKRITPRRPTRPAPREEDISFSGSASNSFPPRSIFDRHLRQRPPSMSSLRGDCASMYNTNQKCEKLAMENDCLKRQLELLESRHRDSQMKLMEQMHRRSDEETYEGDHPGTSSSASCKTAKTNAYSYSRRRKKKWSDRRRIAVLLLFAPFLISSTIWLYQSVRSTSTNGSGTTNGINNLTSMMREGVLGNSLLSETVDSLFSDNSSDTSNEETTIIDDDIDENPLILHEPPPEFGEFESEKDGQKTFSKMTSRINRFASRIEFSHHNNPMGVWYGIHRRITTQKRHAEL